MKPFGTIRSISISTILTRNPTFNDIHRFPRQPYRSYHSSPKASTRPLTIGIRREDPSRIWERRAPLTPQDVRDLLSRSAGLQVHVEPCHRRIFRDDEYTAAGARITPDLRDAHVVLGIKEPPLDEVWVDPLPAPSALRDGSKENKESQDEGGLVPRTYVMFSHTAKGQEYNMPLLSKFIAGSSGSDGNLLPTLVDYELLTDSNMGKRTVGFGWFAGGTCFQFGGTFPF